MISATVLLVLAVSSALEAAPSPPTPAQLPSPAALADAGTRTPADEEAIHGLVESFRQAAEKADAPGLEKLFWPEARIFEPGSTDRDPRGFAKAFSVAAKKEKLKWKEEKNTGRAEGSLAYVAQRATLETQVDGGSEMQVLGFTFVLRKKEGVWKIAHLHLSL